MTWHKWKRKGYGGWGRTDIPGQWTQIYKCQRCFEFKHVDNDTYEQ